MKLLYNALMLSALMAFGMIFIPNTISVLYLKGWLFSDGNIPNTLWYYSMQSIATIATVVILLIIIAVRLSKVLNLKVDFNTTMDTTANEKSSSFKVSLFKPKNVKATITVLITLITLSSIALIVETGVSNFWFVNYQFGLSASIISVVALIVFNRMYFKFSKQVTVQ